MRGSFVTTLEGSQARYIRVEIAAAALLTLFAVVFFGKSARLQSPVQANATLHVAREPVVRDDQTVVEFMEKFALSRVAQPLPENLAVEPVSRQAGPITAPATFTPKAVSVRDPVLLKEKSRATALKSLPPQAPVPRPVESKQPQIVEAPVPAKSDKHIPFLSDIAEKVPTGRDIANAFADFGRKVGSIFGRT